MFALTNAVIYTGFDRLENHAIIINGSRIEQVCPQDQLPKDITVRDRCNCLSRFYRFTG